MQEISKVAVALYIVLQESRGTHGKKKSEPWKEACFRPFFLSNPHNGIINRNAEDTHGGPDLDDADESVRGKITRIISRTLDDKFRSGIKQKKEACRGALFFSVTKIKGCRNKT